MRARLRDSAWRDTRCCRRLFHYYADAICLFFMLKMPFSLLFAACFLFAPRRRCFATPLRCRWIDADCCYASMFISRGRIAAPSLRHYADADVMLAAMLRHAFIAFHAMPLCFRCYAADMPLPLPYATLRHADL